MMTYNHEKYISRAIESILKQKVNFEYEIVIGEDFSTDQTRNILLKYAEQFPERFKLILHEKNIGAMNNQKEVFKKCSGKYIAILEGDDFWLDSEKLQKQVDFLESNNDYIICYTRAKSVDEKGKETGKIIPTKKKIKPFSTFEDQLKGNLIPTLTCVFRAGHFGLIPEFCYQHWCGDWLLHLFNSQYGKIGFIDEITSAYRQHDKGISKMVPLKDQLSNTIETYSSLNEYFDYKYDFTIKKMMAFYFSLLAKEYAIEKDRKKALEILLKTIKSFPIDMKTSFELFKCAIALFVPNFFITYREKPQ